MRLTPASSISVRGKYILPGFIALWIYAFIQIVALREGIIFWPWSIFSPAIPVLAITLTADPEHYVMRLLKSIDHKIDSIIIVLGNENEAITQAITTDIQIIQSERQDLPIKVIKLKSNPGYAHGMNVGLKEILNSKSATWGMLVNSDISFYPGMLRRLSTAVTHSMHRDRKFGIGFPSLCCGGQWSAFAITKALINHIGLFDENIFPMFYEDNDYSVRIHLSGFRSKKFKYIPLIHGKYNGHLKYVSGTTDTLQALGGDSSKDVVDWKAQIKRGKFSSENYLVEKWGFTGKPRYFGCKTVNELMFNCNASYSSPFNSSQVNISAWTFQPGRREWILHGVEPKPFKVFDINRVGDD